MPLFEEVKENLKILIVEVKKQTNDTYHYIRKNKKGLESKIANRDDYIDNLKDFITTKTFRIGFVKEDLSRDETNLIQAINVIASNLERIADYCGNIVSQTRYLSHIKYLDQFNYLLFFKEIESALKQIEPALFKKNIDLALKICRSEFKLDELYLSKFEIIKEKLRIGTETDDLITALFISRYLERIGDALLNIGEAIISSVLGEKLKIHQYMALEESFERSDSEDSSDFQYEALGETKSGCKIAKVRENNHKKDANWVVYKEGNPVKLQQEKRNNEIWEELLPGLTPKVYDYQEKNGNASILFQFMEGDTFQKIVCDRPLEEMGEALEEIKKTLTFIWDKTKKQSPVHVGFIDQLKKRIEDVFHLHPDFNVQMNSIGNLEMPSFMEKINKLSAIEKEIFAPLKVLIHGDFNTDNVIYNADLKKICFIDLYRSCSMDYVQDVSVFILSNYRMPIFKRSVRKRLNHVASDFYSFAREYAANNNDIHFDIRLAFGLVRSFITSTRFVVSKKFANDMFKRANYLIDKILVHDGTPWNRFEVPEKVFIY